jgi:hypothetical protein
LLHAVENGQYPYLYDPKTKDWTVSATVRNVFTMGSGGASSKITNMTDNWMTGGSGHKGSIGPELGIGGMLQKHSSAPTMMLKSCTGPYHQTK